MTTRHRQYIWLELNIYWISYKLHLHFISLIQCAEIRKPWQTSTSRGLSVLLHLPRHRYSSCSSSRPILSTVYSWKNSSKAVDQLAWFNSGGPRLANCGRKKVFNNATGQCSDPKNVPGWWEPVTRTLPPPTREECCGHVAGILLSDWSLSRVPQLWYRYFLESWAGKHILWTSVQNFTAFWKYLCQNWEINCVHQYYFQRDVLDREAERRGFGRVLLWWLLTFVIPQSCSSQYILKYFIYELPLFFTITSVLDVMSV